VTRTPHDSRSSTDASDPSADAHATPAELLWRRRSSLWTLAVAFFAVGDVTTTSVGLGLGRVVEVGPLAAPVVARHGVVAMAALKLVALGCCYLLYRLAPRPHGVGVPLGLATLGALVTGWNVAVVAVAA